MVHYLSSDGFDFTVYAPECELLPSDKAEVIKFCCQEVTACKAQSELQKFPHRLEASALNGLPKQ
jgi:hypothetical protein